MNNTCLDLVISCNANQHIKKDIGFPFLSRTALHVYVCVTCMDDIKMIKELKKYFYPEVVYFPFKKINMKVVKACKKLKVDLIIYLPKSQLLHHRIWANNLFYMIPKLAYKYHCGVVFYNIPIDHDLLLRNRFYSYYNVHGLNYHELKHINEVKIK